MSFIGRGPANDWTWPLPLYEHGGGRELSSKQWDAYKEPVIEVVPASQLQEVISDAESALRLLNDSATTIIDTDLRHKWEAERARLRATYGSK